MNKLTRSPRFPAILIKALIVLLGVPGQLLTLGRSNFMSGAHFLYYTNISNILVLALAIVMLVKEIRAWRAGTQPAYSKGLNVLQFILAAGIMLTFTGFTLLLAPLMPASYLLSLDNLLVHILVPLLACIDFVLFYQGRAKDLRLRYGLILPFSYLLLFLLLAAVGYRFHSGVAPYFFLDYEQNGWLTAGDGKLGVVWWSLILLALQLFLSRLLLGLRKAREGQA